MKPTKGIVKELERERDKWKAEHDDLMKKYDKRGEELEKMQDCFMKRINEKHGELKVEQSIVDRLESQLEAYRANDNPQLTAGLHRRIKYLEEENAERNQAMKEADKERDEAKAQAEQAMDDFKKLHKTYKDDVKVLEQEFSHMKEKHDKLLDYVRLLA